MGVVKLGAWGEPPESIKVMILGNDTWGVFIKEGYTNTGISTSNLFIYTELAGTYHEVFNETVDYDNSGAALEEVNFHSLESTISMQPISGLSFFDLVLTTKEIQGTQETSRKKIFKFDGRRYSSGSLN